MSTSSQNIFSLATSRPVVPPGATASLFVDVLPGQLWTQVKNIGNTGSLEVLQCSTGLSLPIGFTQSYSAPYFSSGSTQTQAMLIALSGTGYLMGANEVLTFAGQPRFYLSAPGASCQVCIIKGLGAGV